MTACQDDTQNDICSIALDEGYKYGIVNHILTVFIPMDLFCQYLLYSSVGIKR